MSRVFKTLQTSGRFFFFFSFTATKARVCSIRYRRYSRYPHGCSTELTEVSGTGIDVVPKLPKYPVPVLMLYRNGRSVRYQYESLYRYRRYRYPCRTGLIEESGIGIDLVPNLPKCPVTVLMSYRTYRSVRYRYWCCTELTEVSGTGNTGGIYRWYASVRTVLNTPIRKHVRSARNAGPNPSTGSQNRRLLTGVAYCSIYFEYCTE